VHVIPLLPTDIATIQASVQEANAFASILGLHRLISEDELVDILSEAFVAASGEYSIRAAQTWAQDYTFPAELLQRDVAAFQVANNDMYTFCTNRQSHLQSERLSLSRVKDCFGSEGQLIPGVHLSDFHRLCTVATEGIQLHLPEGFSPTSEPQPLRTTYVKVSAAVHKMLAAQVEYGTVLILPLQMALTIPGIHFSAQHWAPNKGKPQGRSIGDVSQPSLSGGPPLNGIPPEGKNNLRLFIEGQWDKINHPTLVSLMRMILRHAEIHGWEPLILWKKDLQGAFTLLWFRPKDVPLLAFQLTDDRVAFHLAGMFGWVGMPFIFQVVTRMLTALVAFVILGLCMMYVDDLLAVSIRSTVGRDMAQADEAITLLLGAKAVAKHKDECGRALDWIGWHVDLDHQSVTVSRRNLLKTIHVFFCFHIDDSIELHHLEAMASLASRCSQLCRAMRPYTKALYEVQKLYSAAHTTRRLSALAKVDVCMWRAFLILSRFDPVGLSRPIRSFAPRKASVFIDYDASLTNISVGIYMVDSTAPGGARLRAFTSLDLPFPTNNEARRQNTLEFSCLPLGFLLMHLLGMSSVGTHLRGDSISSLQWAKRDRTSSLIARRANIAFTLVAAKCDYTVEETTHVPGVDNVIFDGLTRGKTATEVGLPPALQLHFPREHPVVQFFDLCDPDDPLDTYAQHVALSNAFIALLTDPLMVLPPDFINL
jgi:hypothetical protein